MNISKDKTEPMKSFTAYLDNGNKYQFSMCESADLSAAATYARLWNKMAGYDGKIVKIKENR